MPFVTLTNSQHIAGTLTPRSSVVNIWVTSIFLKISVSGWQQLVSVKWDQYEDHFKMTRCRGSRK